MLGGHGILLDGHKTVVLYEEQIGSWDLAAARDHAGSLEETAGVCIVEGVGIYCQKNEALYSSSNVGELLVTDII